MMADDKDLPFRAEYAKSSRACCKGCKTTVQKDELRMGIMVQSPRFDGKIPVWHHMKCFFKQQQLKSTGDVANFHSLRWEDQKLIKEEIVGSDTDEAKTEAAAGETVESTEFSVEYAKSSRSVCKQCKEKIMKNDIRISRIDRESVNARKYPPLKAWHHVDCFVKAKDEFGFSGSAQKLPGFPSLSDEDKRVLSTKFPNEAKKRKKKPIQAVSKKPKPEPETEEEKELQAQSALIYDARDKIKKHLNKKQCQLLLEHNNQAVVPGESRILDLISDCMVFGALKHCPECNNGQLKFKDDGYHCTGHLTEWTRCIYFTKTPERDEFKIPEDLAEKFEFLRKYKYVPRQRLLPTNPDAPTSQTAKGSGSPKGPLANFRIAVAGDLNKSKEVIGKLVSDLGGRLVTRIDSSLTCVISTKDEVDKLSKKIKSAKKFNVHVVSEKFLDEVKKGGAALMIKQNTLCDWGGDPLEKIASVNEKAVVKSRSKSEESTSRVVKVTVHGSAYVDHSSGLGEEAVVHQNEKQVAYNAVLNKVDISQGTNSYYKLQVLKAKSQNQYWLFRSWGRVGTPIGGDKLDEFDTAADAVRQFKFYYLEKTGNEWNPKGKFVKQPGLFYPLDIDYGQDLSELQKAKKLKPSGRSTLPLPVRQLICLLFDVDAMKSLMVEFEIDLKKMPLGKLSKKQITAAYKVLTELNDLLIGDKNPTRILDASNRFYTLIPHDFGLKKPTLLDSEAVIKSKVNMLDSLMEIECAFKLLKSGEDASVDPIDQHYYNLQTDIKILDRTSKEYECIEKYLNNTHAETHSHYDLELEEVFKIDRKGEYEKYKSFEHLTNKKLLWHGSRITNFVGILSKGLRIAPPEAPSTGYMFGKGIYFADMVSKSANYCYASSTNSAGLLLLCEVALGDMYEKTYAEYIHKLPEGKHSTKGLGQTAPNPTEAVIMDGVEIPLGKPDSTSAVNSSLLYNEYIIYNTNQVNIKYLLKVNFKYKYCY